MRPFQQFRYWIRRSPLSERVTTGVATLIVVGLIAWLLVPDSDDAAEEEVFASGAGVTETTAPAGEGAAGAPAAAEFEGAAAPEGGESPGAAASGTESGGGAGPAEGGGATPTESPGGGGGTGGGATATATTTTAPRAGCVSPPGKPKGISATEVKVAIALTEIVGPAANELFDVPTPAEAKA